MDVGHRGLDAERVEIGDAGDHVAAPHGRPLLGDDPGEDARAVRARGGELEQPAGVVALLAQRREVELHAFELRVRAAPRALDRRLELLQLDLRLLRLHLGGAGGLLGDEAVRAQLAVLVRAIGGGLGVELLGLDLAAQIDEALAPG